ncbi:ABC transporter permease [bacterium]|nr:ABC transporter permease [bacterium]MCI0606408.1 ABC transporter permease [bacterium]
MTGFLRVLYREYKFRITNVAFLIWDIFVPIAYLLIFGYGFQQSIGGSFAGSSEDYASFFVPGILSMTCFGVAMNTSWRFFMERENGIFYELLTYPVSRTELVIGKILFNIGLSLAGNFLVLLAGSLILNVRIRNEFAPWIFLFTSIGTAAWFFFFASLALRIRRMDIFNTITSLCYILLMFASSMFYPLERLPNWFRWIARVNPVTWLTDLFRFATLGSGNATLLLIQGALLFGFTICVFMMALYALDHAAE